MHRTARLCRCHDQAVILEIAQEVNRVAGEIGFAQEVPLKFSEATGEGGYFDAGIQ